MLALSWGLLVNSPSRSPLVPLKSSFTSSLSWHCPSYTSYQFSTPQFSARWKVVTGGLFGRQRVIRLNLGSSKAPSPPHALRGPAKVITRLMSNLGAIDTFRGCSSSSVVPSSSSSPSNPAAVAPSLPSVSCPSLLECRLIRFGVGYGWKSVQYSWAGWWRGRLRGRWDVVRRGCQ